ncbi:MAG: response regulator [Betaproteobacteria bacterium]|nr:response regulator [Betaproteobacteria bacterium]
MVLAGRSRAAVRGVAQHLRRGRPPGAAGRRRRPDAARDAAGAGKDGWEVSEAENGRVALARIEEARPDIIMLDLMMPEMDGFEFLVEMRSRAEWRDIPVLVVTAKDLTAEERGRLNGDVARVLQKGGSGLDELLAEIARVLPGSIARGRGRKVEEGTQ